MTVTVLHPLPTPRTIADLLREARAQLHRLTPHQAHHAHSTGALLVDIRPHAQRVAEGEIPQALVLERNVLEWRLDPTSDASLPETSYDRTIVIICSEGYTSSLAAATLHLLGLSRATDLDGGFLAWRNAGLPTVAGGTPAGEHSRSRSLLEVDVERWETHVAGAPVHLTFQRIPHPPHARGRQRPGRDPKRTRTDHRHLPGHHPRTRCPHLPAPPQARPSRTSTRHRPRRRMAPAHHLKLQLPPNWR